VVAKVKDEKREYPNITEVHLNITHRCNLACKYCYVRQECLDMPIEVALKSIDFLAQSAKEAKRTPFVCFFGGEPLLRWNDIIIPTVQYAKEKYKNSNFGFSITTNGTLLTMDKIKFLKENRIKLLISVDGCAPTQNYNRPFHDGRGSLMYIEPYMRAALREKLTHTFRATIIPETCQYMYENYLYAIRLKYPIFFALVDSFSTWDDEHEKLLRREFEKIADHYIAYYKKHKKAPIELSMLRRHLKKAQKDIATGNTKRARIVPRMKCGLGQTKSAAISPNGDIYGCQELTSNEGAESVFYIGNIYTGTIDERRDRLAKIYEDNPVSGDMDCNKCSARTACNGGCVANNYLQCGIVSQSAHGYCMYQRILYETAIKIAKELKLGERKNDAN
jgi:radical SAM protein with 4Fe4S-binding SPASM domain